MRELIDLVAVPGPFALAVIGLAGAARAVPALIVASVELKPGVYDLRLEIRGDKIDTFILRELSTDGL